MKQPIDVSITDFWINDFGRLEVEITVDIDGKVSHCKKEITDCK